MDVIFLKYLNNNILDWHVLILDNLLNPQGCGNLIKNKSKQLRKSILNQQNVEGEINHSKFKKKTKKKHIQLGLTF